MRKLTIADLPDGGTPATLAAIGAGWGPVTSGGISRYEGQGHRTHDETGPHVHTVPEIFCIVAGSGVVELDGVPETPFVAGDVLIIEPGEDHHLISTGVDPLVFTWMHLAAPV
jgi:mannose-6-phosphate isomerase-like protein (cupin superfamily)